MLVYDVDQLSEQGKYDRITIAATVCAALALLSLTGFISNFADTLSDFSAFYAAGHLANSSEAKLAYDLDSFRAFYGAIFPGAPAGYGWFYPPTFMLLQQPLAELSYPWARAVWLVGTFGVYIWAMRPFAKSWQHWVLIVSIPAIAFHWHSGQTGFLIAALFAFAITGLDRQDARGDWEAGIAIGLLTIKPHLWLLIPIFLMIEGRWRTIAVAGFVTLLMVMLSVLAYGIGPWHALVASAFNGYVDNHANQVQLFAKMGNIGGLMQYWGFAGSTAPLLLAVATLSTVMLYGMKKADAPLALRLGLAVSASFLIAPHNMIYDHTLFVPLCAFMVASGFLVDRPLLQVSTALLLAWPALFALVPGLDGFPFSFFVVLFFALAIGMSKIGGYRPRQRVAGGC
ncbi:MAG: glycosyltransferase family 87 protein [Pseudomonadota bacterium]